MTPEGYGSGLGSNLRHDPDLLHGVLASEDTRPAYPDNYCRLCEREGVTESATCFHRHWRVADEPGVAERR